MPLVTLRIIGDRCGHVDCHYLSVLKAVAISSPHVVGPGEVRANRPRGHFKRGADRVKQPKGIYDFARVCCFQREGHYKSNKGGGGRKELRGVCTKRLYRQRACGCTIREISQNSDSDINIREEFYQN